MALRLGGLHEPWRRTNARWFFICAKITQDHFKHCQLQVSKLPLVEWNEYEEETPASERWSLLN